VCSDILISAAYEVSVSGGIVLDMLEPIGNALAFLEGEEFLASLFETRYQDCC
jgi:hypothetical protein